MAAEGSVATSLQAHTQWAGDVEGACELIGVGSRASLLVLEWGRGLVLLR